MKSSKIKQIPMFPTHYYDSDIECWVKNDTLSHADYDGESRYSPMYDEFGKNIGTIKPVYVENKPWKDTLRYESYYRGRSAAGALFTNQAGQRFTVFMTDLNTFIPLMVNGVITSNFIYCKRGKNYGIALYDGEV